MPVCLHRHHGGAGIHRPGSLTGQALHHRGAGGEKRLDGPRRVGGRHPGKDDLPFGRLKAQRVQPASGRACAAGLTGRPG